MGGCCLLLTHLLGILLTWWCMHGWVLLVAYSSAWYLADSGGACMGGCCLLPTHLLGILLIWWCMHGWVLLVAYSSAWYLADLVVHAWVGVACCLLICLVSC